MIELPKTGIDEKLNAKGLAGHSAIMIGDEYYYFGPQPSEPFYSKGRPWWDTMSKSGNLKRNDIIAILEDQQLRLDWNIVGSVCLIDIEVSVKEKEDLEKWWKEKYKNPGIYSVIPVFGEQCTSNVRISLEENTDVFDLFTLKVQKPIERLELLLKSSKNTYGKYRGKRPILKKKYNEISNL